MFKKLKLKFIITIMLLLTSIVVILFSAIYITTKKNYDYLLFSQVEDTLNEVRSTEDNHVSAKGRFVGDSILVYMEGKDNSIIYSTELDIDKEEIKDLVKVALMDKAGKGFIDAPSSKYVFDVSQGPRGIKIVFQDCSYYTSSLHRLIIEFIIIGTFSLIILFVLSVIIARKAVKPVEAAYNSQKRFIGDASHELKTPLAVIKTNIDVLKSNKEDTIKNQEKWFDYICFQTDRMSKLVSNLLYLAKSDNNEVLGKECMFNISDTIMNQILSFEATAYESGINLDCDIDEKIDFYGDKEAFNQLVGILVDNAIKHSYKDTTINVLLYTEKQKIYYKVKNKGETIPPEDIDKIFDRFYRVDKSRERARGGYGLGLSIAKSIVTRYKGKISATSINNITEFTVELPALKNSSKIN